MPKLPNLADVDIIEACSHRSLLNIPLSVGQRTFLKASDGLGLDQQELDLYCAATGHSSYTSGRYVRNPVLAAGRRFGKTHHICVPQAIHAALFRNYDDLNLRPGEHPTVLFLAPTISQSDIDHRAIVAVISGSPTLRAFMPIFKRRGALSLKNGVDIVVQKCDLRSVRGFPIAFCCAEECNFWRSESDPTQNPAEEVLGSVRPALLTFPFGRLLMVSSPWSKSGPMWAAFARRAETRDPLCMRMTSLQGNPTLDPALLKQEQERDPERYEREINAEWLDAASALLPSDALEACIVKGRYENAPKSGVVYHLGLDVAFRSDMFGAVWSHAEGDRVIVDCARGWKPRPGKAVNFAATMDEIIERCRYYGCTRASADMVSNEVVRQRLQQAGIKLEQVSTGGRRSGGIYQSLRAKVLAGEAELLDHPELLSQLRKLEVTRSSGGGERVESPSGFDDIATACALSVYESVARGKPNKPWIEVLDVGLPRDERMWLRM